MQDDGGTYTYDDVETGYEQPSTYGEVIDLDDVE